MAAATLPGRDRGERSLLPASPWKDEDHKNESYIHLLDISMRIICYDPNSSRSAEDQDSPLAASEGLGELWRRKERAMAETFPCMLCYHHDHFDATVNMHKNIITKEKQSRI